MTKHENQQEETMQRSEMNNVAEKNFSYWADSLLEQNPDVMAKFYSKDSTFHPTLSPNFKKGPEEARSYFVHFLQKKPSGKIVEETIKPYGEDVYHHQGLYDFQVGPENDRQTVNAVYTYVWRKNENGEWQIIHHHSSILENKELEEKYLKELLAIIKNESNGRIIEEANQKLNENANLRSGIFTFKDEAGKDIEARFSIVEETDENGKTQITKHHLSTRPQEH